MRFFAAFSCFKKRETSHALQSPSALHTTSENPLHCFTSFPLRSYSKMQQVLLALAFGYASALAPTRTALRSPRTTVRSSQQGQMSMSGDVVLIGVAADSGCGKSTFMRRLTGIFGGTNVGPLGGGFDAGSWETNTLVSDTTTVICLDDYHLSEHPASSDRNVFSREFCLKLFFRANFA